MESRLRSVRLNPHGVWNLIAYFAFQPAPFSAHGRRPATTKISRAVPAHLTPPQLGKERTSLGWAGVRPPVPRRNRWRILLQRLLHTQHRPADRCFQQRQDIDTQSGVGRSGADKFDLNHSDSPGRRGKTRATGLLSSLSLPTAPSMAASIFSVGSFGYSSISMFIT